MGLYVFRRQIQRSLFSCVGLILFLVPQQAALQPVTHTLTIPLTTTNWSQSITVPKFPAANGTLTQVTFTLQSTMSGTLRVESLDSSGATVQSTLSAIIHIRRPDMTMLMTHSPSVSVDKSFSAYDGATDYTGASGTTHPLLHTSSGSTALTALSASDIALFTGTGTVTLPVTAVANSAFSGGGNLHSIAAVAASATITVTYTYVEPDLAITKTRSGTPVIGRQIQFNLGVTNVGSGHTTGLITVSDTMPSGLGIVSAHGAGWTCTVVGRVVTCTQSGPLAAGGTLSPIIVTVNVTSGAYPSVINTASVSTAGDRDTFLGANTASLLVTVQQPSESQVDGDDGGSDGGSDIATIPPDVEPLPIPDPPEKFAGPKAGNSGAVIDAQGCPVDPIYTSPIATAGLDLCLTFDPNRPVTLTDIDGDPHHRFIEALKKTHITKTGDYVLGGNGNNSTRNQGSFPFQPSRVPNRFEIARLVLISNCIGIEEEAPESAVTFHDVPRTSDDPAQAFMARVVYTAAAHGILQGYKDGNALPGNDATNGEILALLLRASNAMPRGFTLQSSTQWYDPYVAFAKHNRLVANTFNPQGSMTRSDMSALLVRIMAFNPDPQINGYAAQLQTHAQLFSAREFIYLPVPSVGPLTPEPGTTCAERSPMVNACLTYHADRPITFTDLPPNLAESAAIELLKKTSIVPDGDFVFSGVGNQSTGKQQDKYKTGAYPFDPESEATRLEVVKTALVSNCLPILDSIPQTDVTFSDIPKQRSDDDVADFTARVFYSAEMHGVITGFADGTARPQQQATKLETVAILLRASRAVPVDYQTVLPIISDLRAGGWYDNDVSFAVRNGIVPLSEDRAFHPYDPIIRTDLATLLTEIMRYSGDLRVRSYRTSVDPLLR